MKATMSGLGRVELCPPSAFLSRVEESTRDADRGLAIHGYLRAVATEGAEKALEQVPELYRGECDCIDLSLLPHSDPSAWAVEVGLAWDWEADTGRELFRGDGRRDYSSAGATELCGTADLLGVTSDAVAVLDIKTGWARLAPPAEAPQLLGYAVAAARAYGKERAIVGWIKLRDDTPYFEVATLDMLELDAAAARLRDIIEGAIGAELVHQADPGATVPVVGSHCRYCPAYRQCPANVGLLADLVYRDKAGEVPVLNEETAPLVLVRVEAAQKVLDRVMASLRDYADVSPILLPGGEVFGRTTTTKEKIDALVAKNVLSEDLWDEAVKIEHTLTKADLKRALQKRLAPGEKISHVERDCLKALTEAGAMRESSFTSVRKFKPKPTAATATAKPVSSDEALAEAVKVEHELASKLPEPPSRPSPKPAEVVQFRRPRPQPNPELIFGPDKGKLISTLTAEELARAITLAQEKLENEPVAPWAGAISGQLDHLAAEQQRRMDEIGGAS